MEINPKKSGIDKFPEPFRSSLISKVNRTMNRSDNYHEPSGWFYRQLTNQAFVMFEMISPLGAQSQIAQGNPYPTESFTGIEFDGTAINYKNDHAESTMLQWEWVSEHHHPDSAVGVFYNDECIGWSEYGYVPNSNYLTFQALPIMLYDGSTDSGAPEGTLLSELDFKYFDGSTGEEWDVVLSPVGTPYVNYNGNYAYPPYEEIGGIFPGVFNWFPDAPYVYNVAWEPCTQTIFNADSSCIDPYAFPPVSLGPAPPPNYCSSFGEGTHSDLSDGLQNLEIFLIEGLSITGPDIHKSDFCVNGKMPYFDCQWTASMENPNPEPNLVSFPILKDNNTLEEIFGNNGPVYKIIGEGVASQLMEDPDDGPRWVGSVEVINPFSGYWVYNYDSSPGYIYGPIDRSRCISSIYEEIIYDMHFGANLISYPFQYPLSVEEGLFGYENKIEGVVGDSEAVVYMPDGPEGPAWYGSLTEFKPGKGYWFKMNQSTEFEWIPVQMIARRTSGSDGQYKPLIKHMMNGKYSNYIEYLSELHHQRQLRRTSSQRFFYHPLEINNFDTGGNISSTHEILESAQIQIMNNMHPGNMLNDCNNINSLMLASRYCKFPRDWNYESLEEYHRCLSQCRLS